MILFLHEYLHIYNRTYVFWFDPLQHHVTRQPAIYLHNM